MHTAEHPRPAKRDAGGATAVRVAVAGATGYTGQELLRILARHPAVTITAATSSGAASSTGARKLPSLRHLFKGEIIPLDSASLAQDADVVFLALPDKAAAELAPTLVDAGVRVIDLSGAFRLRDEALRARWYPETHAMPRGLAYGLTELEHESVATARMVANPGCYPTATLLALRPLASAGLLVSGSDVVVDAKSGVSGAGKTPSERTHFSEVHGSVAAYGVFGHRHGAEIEQGIGGQVNFVPHLMPLDRGILSTIYVRLAPGTTEDALASVYERTFGGEPFIRLVGAALPEIKHVAHTNFCDIGWRVDPTGRAVLVSVIDNLLKGASGQAVQNMNVMLGLDQTTGLLVKPPVVLKFGGELLEAPARLKTVVASIVQMSASGTPLAIVHGGGKEIDAALKRAGIEKRQVEGLRITDEPTLDIVVSVLAGLVNTRLVAALSAAGVPAVGLTGADAGCGVCDVAPPHETLDGRSVDLGHVGVPSAKADTRVLLTLLNEGVVPVLCSIGMTKDGQLLNVNADTMAGHLAGALRARRLVIAGSTAGVLDDAGKTVALLDPAAITRLVTSGTATAGMIAKLRACEQALAGGVDDVVIVNGSDGEALSATASGAVPAAATRIVTTVGTRS